MIKVKHTVSWINVYTWTIAAPVTAKDLDDAIAAARQEMTRLNHPEFDSTAAISVTGDSTGITVTFTTPAAEVPVDIERRTSRADAWDQGYQAGTLASDTSAKANPYRRAFP